MRVKPYPLGKYGLLWVLLFLWLTAWALQTWAQYYELRQNAAEHGQALDMNVFFIAWLRATMENWQSEFLQLFTFTGLTIWLIAHRSPQSRDGADETSLELEMLDAKMNAIALKLGIEPGEIERLVLESKLH